jgi:RNA polymerase sigma factor (sigma-70 family)
MASYTSYADHHVYAAEQLVEVLRKYFMKVTEGLILETENLVRDATEYLQRACAADARLSYTRGFVFAVVERRALRWLRGRKLHRKHYIARDLESDGGDVEPEVDEYEQREWLSAISSMPRVPRQALMLRAAEGQSVEEIARKLRVTERTAKRHLVYALKYLMAARRNSSSHPRDAGVTSSDLILEPSATPGLADTLLPTPKEAVPTAHELAEPESYNSSRLIEQLPEQMVAVVGPRIVTANETLALKLQRQPESVHELSARQFVELVGELLTDLGADVVPMPVTWDGGKDLLAYLDTYAGRVLCLVEVKKYRRDRPVGVDLVRALYGTLCDHGATNAMLVTTSSFTEGAYNLQRRHEYRLTLRDYSDLVLWIRRYRGRRN